MLQLDWAAMSEGSPPDIAKAVMEFFTMPKLALNSVRMPVCVPSAGNGEPVMVIPGMMSGDHATSFLRRSLDASGFDARPSGLIFNTGATPKRIEMLEHGIAGLRQEFGQPVAVVGWSLGGLFARLLARRRPENISAVMTLGSPFSGDPHANNAWRLYELINGHPVTHSPFPEDIAVKPPTKSIAVWSPNDGVIAPESARGQPHESDRQIEVAATHMEMATGEQTVRTIIEVLGEELE